MAVVMALALLATGCAGAQETPAWQPSIVCAPEDGEGKIKPEKPFMVFPFGQEHANDIDISSGWITAEDEVDVVRSCDHHALDFQIAPTSDATCDQFELRAPGAGWAVATYQAAVGIGAADNDPPFNELHVDPITGKTSWLGEAGLVVQIILKQPDLPVADAVGGSKPTVQLMHLASVDSSITWIPPVLKSPTKITGGGEVETWTPEGLVRSQEQIINGSDGYPPATEVNEGDVIGMMGRTGINSGVSDRFDPVTHTVVPQGPGWDFVGVPLEKQCQLHMYMYAGRKASGTKVGNFDPTDMYLQIKGQPGTDSYYNPQHPYPEVWVMGPSPAFQQYPDGQPVFAGAR